MNIKEAISALESGKKVRHENFAAGTCCTMLSGTIWDEELGYISVGDFINEYGHLDPDGWTIYE